MTEQATVRRPATGRRALHSEPMVVAVEATRLAREVRGIGRDVRALLPRLVSQQRDVRLVLFVRSLADADRIRALFDDSMQSRVDIRTVGSMTRSGADVFWFPWNTTGPTPRRGCVVVTMHD